MAVRNTTQWSPPSGKGYVSSSSGALLTSQSGMTLTDQSGVQLIINDDIYKTEFPTGWTLASKNKSSWLPPSGQGYVINVGAENLITNLGAFLVTNDSKQIVTTPTYDKNKTATAWTLSGV